MALYALKKSPSEVEGAFPSPLACAATETESHLGVLAVINRSADLLPLCQLPAGETGCVRELAGTPQFCQRIRELGFGESTRVLKIGGRGPFLCAVNGNRIALNHDAAKNILVEILGRRA